MGIAERIADIEKEMARTQKNKATEYHLGLLKARLAKLRAELIESSQEASGKGEGFDVSRCGNARVALIGLPSVGKSTLLSSITNCESEVAAYEFTTLTCIPGMVEYNDTKIQILDLPGIIEGAAQGVGRGKQVISVARTADLILIMLDAIDGYKQLPLLVKELEACGIRLNKKRPDIYFKQKKTGGVKISKTCSLTMLKEDLAVQILSLYKIHNCEIIFRQDCTEDEFIDVVVGNRIYIPAIHVYNKIDRISIQDIDRLSRQPHSMVIRYTSCQHVTSPSCNYKLNFDNLMLKIWKYLGLIRIYTKRSGEMPDFTEPIILKHGSTMKDACLQLHKTLAEQYKYGVVWGRSVKYNPQRVGLQHPLSDEDVIQITKF